jgi:hypothetical protein
MANEQVEQFNRDTRKYLITMLDDTADWAAFIMPLQFASNTAVSKSTHFTPYLMIFLDNPRLLDPIFQPSVTYSPTYSTDAFRRMQYAYELVYKNTEEARQAFTNSKFGKI